MIKCNSAISYNCINTQSDWYNDSKTQDHTALPHRHVILMCTTLKKNYFFYYYLVSSGRVDVLFNCNHFFEFQCFRCQQSILAGMRHRAQLHCHVSLESDHTETLWRRHQNRGAFQSRHSAQGGEFLLSQCCENHHGRVPSHTPPRSCESKSLPVPLCSSIPDMCQRWCPLSPQGSAEHDLCMIKQKVTKKAGSKADQSGIKWTYYTSSCALAVNSL